MVSKVPYVMYSKTVRMCGLKRLYKPSVTHLTRKAERAGGQLKELNTRKLKMSQYDHISDSCTKKPLHQRWHRLGETDLIVQRDIYSAFLAAHAEGTQHNPSQLKQHWVAAESLLRRAGLCRIYESAKGLPSGEPAVAIPSERIARQRRLKPSHGREGVVAEQSKARARRPLV